MRLSMAAAIMVGSMLLPRATWAETNAGAASDAPSPTDPSLSQKGDGCVWRVPAKVALLAKKAKHKRSQAAVSHVLFEGVSCKSIRVIAVRNDGQKAAITAAEEGAPQSVATGPGNIAMVYPLIYQMFEADLTNGKVAEFGLPKFDFPYDLRPAAVVGYNRRDTLVIVATGVSNNDNTSVLQRFTPSRQGWSVIKPVEYKTDREQDPKELCGDNFVIQATLVKDLVNGCVK